MRCWEVVPAALLTGGRTSIPVRRTYADGPAPPVLIARTPRSCLSTARQDFLRITQLGEPRTPCWVQEAYVKRVFVVEKMPPGRQPLWDRKNQSRARSPGRYQNVTLIIASHTNCGYKAGLCYMALGTIARESSVHAGI